VTEAEAPQFLQVSRYSVPFLRGEVSDEILLQDPPYVRADFFGADFDALGELIPPLPILDSLPVWFVLTISHSCSDCSYCQG
jgi:hypothetical protein